MTITLPTPPPIDLDAVKAALYQWPFSPIGDALTAEGIDPKPVARAIAGDPSIESLVAFWELDRQRPEVSEG